jgi:hypothetical protein
LSIGACVAAEPPPAIDPPTDGGTVEGGPLGEGGPADGGSNDTFVYVSASGDDANTGLTSDKPVKTIANALSIAETKGRSEVHLCGGVYFGKNILIGKPIVIRGAYDCKTWQRQANYGKREKFAGLSHTEVGPIDGAVGSTFSITGGAAVTLDGLDVTSTGPGQTIEVKGAASLTIRDSRVYGSRINSVGATAGIVVQGATVDIIDCEVHGGNGVAGTLDAYGSAAVEFVSGGGRINNSELHAGNGTSDLSDATASIGVRAKIAQSASLTIERSRIVADAPKATSSRNLVTVFSGAEIFGSGAARIENSEIYGDSKYNVIAGINKVVGISVFTTSGPPVQVLNNRIDLGGPATSSALTCVSASIDENASAELVNNAIISGCLGSGAREGLGIEVRGTAKIVHNSILLRGINEYPVYGWVMRATGKGTFDNNLVVGRNPTSRLSLNSVALLSEQCPNREITPALTSVQGNVISAAYALVATADNGNCISATYQNNIDFLSPTNIRFVNTYVDPGVDMFTEPYGPLLYAALLTSGWNLRECRYSRSGIQLNPAVDKDIIGASRANVRPTAGAWQLPVSAGCP